MRAARAAVLLLLLHRADVLFAAGPAARGADPRDGVVVLVSADAEWRAVRSFLTDEVKASPYGEWLLHAFPGETRGPVVVLHGGWGKIAAAASTQYAITRFRPRLLVNLGTCGGFAGAMAKGDVLLVEKAVVYDIVEQMGDSAEAIASYTADIDLAWAPRELPAGTRRGVIASGDRDLLPRDVPMLGARYKAVAGDWESGAIAWVARANRTPVLILRGVSDVVTPTGSEAYGNIASFEESSRAVMKSLFDQLPFWLGHFEKAKPSAVTKDR